MHCSGLKCSPRHLQYSSTRRAINRARHYFMVSVLHMCLQNYANIISRIHLEAPWISNRHFRIYSIVYDLETEPFVYAEDLSSNGNNTWLYERDHCWEPCLIEKSTTILLSQGNKFRLCDGTTFVYHSDWTSPIMASSLVVDELQDLEKEVSIHISYESRSLN